MFETCRNSLKLFHIIKVLNVATVDALGVIISIRGVSFHGKDYHIGVGSNVVCSTLKAMLEPRLVERTTDVSTLFLCL